MAVVFSVTLGPALWSGDALARSFGLFAVGCAGAAFAALVLGAIALRRGREVSRPGSP